MRHSFLTHIITLTLVELDTRRRVTLTLTITLTLTPTLTLTLILTLTITLKLIAAPELTTKFGPTDVSVSFRSEPWPYPKP